MIDPKVQAELRARYNPDGSDLRKMQLRMLDMLKYIDKICRENNIKYWLSSGTCLGAVRHGGFIPWDDDADIELEKEDFKKLCKILKKKNRYFLQDYSTDSEYLHPFAKLRDSKSRLHEHHVYDKRYKFHGIFIDIFCIEPSSSLFLYKISLLLQSKLFSIQHIKNKFIRTQTTKFLIISFRAIIFPLISFFSRFNNKGQYRHIPGSGFIYPRQKQDFTEIKYVTFEDTELPIPYHAEEYLTKIYGDFLTLPLLDSIKPHALNIEFKDN